SASARISALFHCSVFPSPTRSKRASLSSFFNDTATTEIYTLSLHDALPISNTSAIRKQPVSVRCGGIRPIGGLRSEEHTSELQSHLNLVCRLLLEKKKT